MTVQSVRFSDTDLRTYPQLTDIAIEYAADYAGDWEFMVAARSLAIQSGTLPTATARAVLNAMRADPKVVMSLPELCDLEPAPRHQRVALVERRRNWMDDTVIEAIRYPFNVELRWNMDFVLATHKSATAAHLLNHERSHLVYIPAYSKHGTNPQKTPYQFKLKTECGSTPATAHLFDNAMGRYTCHACLTLRDERHLERVRTAYVKGE